MLFSNRKKICDFALQDVLEHVFAEILCFQTNACTYMYLKRAVGFKMASHRIDMCSLVKALSKTLIWKFVCLSVRLLQQLQWPNLHSSQRDKGLTIFDIGVIRISWSQNISFFSFQVRLKLVPCHTDRQADGRTWNNVLQTVRSGERDLLLAALFYVSLQNKQAKTNQTTISERNYYTCISLPHF